MSYVIDNDKHIKRMINVVFYSKIMLTPKEVQDFLFNS